MNTQEASYQTKSCWTCSAVSEKALSVGARPPTWNASTRDTTGSGERDGRGGRRQWGIAYRSSCSWGGSRVTRRCTRWCRCRWQSLCRCRCRRRGWRWVASLWSNDNGWRLVSAGTCRCGAAANAPIRGHWARVMKAAHEAGTMWKNEVRNGDGTGVKEIPELERKLKFWMDLTKLC